MVAVAVFSKGASVNDRNRAKLGHGALSSSLALCVMWDHSPLSPFGFNFLINKASSLSKRIFVFEFLSRLISPYATF